METPVVAVGKLADKKTSGRRGIRKDPGDGPADDDVETFRAAFKAGHRVAFGGQEVVIKQCGRPIGRLEDNWFVVFLPISKI